MKVLILHQHFKTPLTGGAIRSYYLAKALVDAGYGVVVITAHNEPQYKNVFFEGIRVHYLPIPYDNRFGFYKRIAAFFRFLLQSVKVAARCTDVELCYAISTPLTVGLAAVRISRRLKIPYLFEVGDLWPDAPIQMGIIRNRSLQRLAYWMEKTVYQHAAAVVALSPSIRASVLRKVPGKPVHFLPNMADTGFFGPADKLPALEEKFAVKGKFVVSYIGAVGIANGLHYYLHCAARAQQQGLAMHFLLCGDGAMVDELKNNANSLALTNLTFIPFQNRGGVAEIMNVTDACFICYKSVSILETGSPNKYFDALAAGKLVIVNFGGWIRHQVEEVQCGVYVNAAEPGDFVTKIKPFIDNVALLRQHQHAARQLAEKQYSRRMLATKFTSLVSAAAGHHPAA